MAIAESAPDPTARFTLGWVSNAMLWSSTTKRLLNTNEPGESALAMVAFHLCLKYVCRLVDGRSRAPDLVQVRANCPIEARQLRRRRDYVQRIRNEILHLADENEEGRGHTWHWSRTFPYFAFESSVGERGNVTRLRISRPEMEKLLVNLDPWLHGHWERLVEEEREANAPVLAAKIDGAMRALGGAAAEPEASGGE